MPLSLPVFLLLQFGNMSSQGVCLVRDPFKLLLYQPQLPLPELPLLPQPLLAQSLLLLHRALHDLLQAFLLLPLFL